MKPLNSVFDEYTLAQNPTAAFVWEEIHNGPSISKSEIVCEGELQELDLASGTVQPWQYYVLTSDNLWQCEVTSTKRSRG